MFGRKFFWEITIWATQVGRLGDKSRDVWVTKMNRYVTPGIAAEAWVVYTIIINHCCHY